MPYLPPVLVSFVLPQDKGVETRAHRVTEPSEEVRVLLCVLVHKLIEVIPTSPFYAFIT